MSLEDTLVERGGRYGSFYDHSIICDTLLSVLEGSASWRKMATDQRQALRAICDKIARI